ncbi:MAG: phosphate ABC transporter substrate-binding protein [Bdellovibrionales bacterium]|nr:phosphate ABC transporter substrate-binding protein [Massilia sp.]
MQTSSLRCLTAALLSASLCQLASAGDLVVIVSSRSSVSALRQEQVADIFLGQIAKFPSGADVVALDQEVGSADRDEFYNKVAAKTRPLVKAYWTKMIFTGRGQPPKEVGSSAAIRKMVADNPNLIGYIDKSALDLSVRTVLVVR